MTKRLRVKRGQAIPEFERLVAIETDDCVLWPYGQDHYGYGVISVDGETRKTHALACERAHGPKPRPSDNAAHACRNRHCMNGRHLRWATPAENTADQLRDGTRRRGADIPSAVLTSEEVREMRELYQTGEWTQEKLGERYGIQQASVSNIINRRSWKWLK